MACGVSSELVHPLVVEIPQMRREMVRLIRQAVGEGRRAYVYVLLGE